MNVTRAQRHHEHAHDVDVRLGRVLRERQPGRRDAPGRQRLRGHGLRDARPLPARDRGARRGARAAPSSRWRADVVRRAAARGGRRSARRPGGSPQRIPGYLPDRERTAASSRRSIGYRVPARTAARAAHTWPRRCPGYLGSDRHPHRRSSSRLPLVRCARVRRGPRLARGCSALLALVPASDLAIALVNRAVMQLLGPRRLPRLALREGVPPALRTMVVVPTLLTNEAEIEAQLRAARGPLSRQPGRRRCASPCSPTGPTPARRRCRATTACSRRRRDGDPAPQRAASAGAGRRASASSCFHRQRLWNAGEGNWMGWERKRGKLHEFNRLLRGATDTTLPRAGRPAARGARRRPLRHHARRRHAAAAGRRPPAGRDARASAQPARASIPRLAASSTGTRILQPRVTPTLPRRGEALACSSGSSPARPGIDPYAAAVSDVYQDLFGEGSYTGKGIYDVDAFEAALAGRMPENALLSHDLFEGLFARAGLVTDIELFEEFPLVVRGRRRAQHRWARGDWQLLPWILRGRAAGAVPTPAPRDRALEDGRQPAPHARPRPRRLLTLVAGWTHSRRRRLAVDGVRPRRDGRCRRSCPSLVELLAARRGISKRSLRPRASCADLALGGSAARARRSLFLAHQAWLMGDAIVRTLVPRRASRAATARVGHGRAGEGRPRPRAPAACYRRMAGGGRSGGRRRGVLVALAAPTRWPFAAPFIVAVAPRRRLGRPVGEPAARATGPSSRCRRPTARTLRVHRAAHLALLRDVRRPARTTTCRPTTSRKTRSRSSPTAPRRPTSGLYLLSALAARDLGWIGTLDTRRAARGDARDAWRSLERFRGHFYNWYDTRDLRPLEPRYVSTVDSGNLAGHLIVLAQRVPRDDRCGRCSAARRSAGIEDALLLAREAAPPAADDRRSADRHPARISTRRSSALAASLAAAARRARGPSGWRALRELRRGRSSTSRGRSRPSAATARRRGARVGRATEAAIESHGATSTARALAATSRTARRLARDRGGDRGDPRLRRPRDLAELPDRCAATLAQLDASAGASSRPTRAAARRSTS